MSNDQMKICLILNPKSGMVHRFFNNNPAGEILDFFGEQDFSIDIKTTAKRGEARTLAAEAVNQGYNHIIAGGGDGTINEVLNGIIDKDVVMGVLPMGTENVFCKAMGIPLEIKEACRHFLESKEKRIDVGVANKHHFLMMAGIGLDAHIISDMDPELKKALGGVGFILKGVDFLVHRIQEVYRPTVKLRLNDKDELIESKFWIILVGNQSYYSGTIKLATKAKIDDGLLDILVFPFIDNETMLQQLVSAMTETHLELGEVMYYQSKDFTIETDHPIFSQADGELIDKTPLHFTVKHKALRIRI